MSNETLIEVRDLSVEFISGDQTQRVVEGISFDIRRGETLALVGESARRQMSCPPFTTLLPTTAR